MIVTSAADLLQKQRIVTTHESEVVALNNALKDQIPTE